MATRAAANARLPARWEVILTRTSRASTRIRRTLARA
jgi:hypothetical protein